MLYVVDSVTRKWMEQAKAQGQPIAKGAPDGTFAAGVLRVTELMPTLMNDIIATAPEDQKVRIQRCIERLFHTHIPNSSIALGDGKRCLCHRCCRRRQRPCCRHKPSSASSIFIIHSPPVGPTDCLLLYLRTWTHTYTSIHTMNKHSHSRHLVGENQKIDRHLG